MNQKTRELWLIPVIVSFGTGTLLLIASIYVNAWATGATLRTPFTLGWVKTVLVYCVPLWGVLLFGASVTLATLYLRDRAINRSTPEADLSENYRPHRFTGAPDIAEVSTKAQSDLVAPKFPLTSAAVGTLVFESSELLAVRIAAFENSGVRGVQLQIENYRLTAIHQIRVVIASSNSFDARHQALSRSDGLRPGVQSS